MLDLTAKASTCSSRGSRRVEDRSLRPLRGPRPTTPSTPGYGATAGTAPTPAPVPRGLPRPSRASVGVRRPAPWHARTGDSAGSRSRDGGSGGIPGPRPAETEGSAEHGQAGGRLALRVHVSEVNWGSGTKLHPWRERRPQPQASLNRSQRAVEDLRRSQVRYRAKNAQAPRRGPLAAALVGQGGGSHSAPQVGVLLRGMRPTIHSSHNPGSARVRLPIPRQGIRGSVVETPRHSLGTNPWRVAPCAPPRRRSLRDICSIPRSSAAPSGR